MRRFMITNLYNMYNLGEVLQLRTLVQHLPQDTFVIDDTYTFVDKEVCKSLKVDTIGTGSPSKLSFVKAVVKALLSKSSVIRAIKSCDAIIDLGGDTFSDNPSPLYTLVHVASLIPAMRTGRPYIICSQSIGPFKSPITRLLAKYVLSHALLVTARDPVSYKYLTESMGLDSAKVHLVPDLAFSMSTTSKRGHWVGICPSQIAPSYLGWNYDEYVKVLAHLVRTLQSQGQDVVLIPHVLGPTKGLGRVSNVDDQELIGHIQRLVDVETKPASCIPECKCLISFRWHACITAIAHKIPTINLSYSSKTSGLPVSKGVGIVKLQKESLGTLESSILATYDALKGTPEPPDSSRHFELIDQYYKTYTERFIGPYLKCYVGYSGNKGIRAQGASGGVATSLLITASNQDKRVVGVLSGRYERLSTPDKILDASGSHYNILGTNPSRLMTEVLTGLPCQLKAYRQTLPNTLLLGLFCSHRVETCGPEELLRTLNLQGPVAYRTKYVGTTGMTVKSCFIPSNQYWKKLFNYTYIPKQCLQCTDMCSEYSDISLGDAWGMPEAESEGLNIIIVRTLGGLNLLQEAALQGLVILKEVSPRTVMNTQPEFLRLKKGCPTLKGRVYKVLRMYTNRLPKWIVKLWIKTVIHPLPLKSSTTKYLGTELETS